MREKSIKWLKSRAAGGITARRCRGVGSCSAAWRCAGCQTVGFGDRKEIELQIALGRRYRRQGLGARRSREAYRPGPRACPEAETNA